MPSIRSLALGAGAVVLLGLQGVAAAQSATGGSELGLGARLGIRFGTSLVVSLLLGGALVAFGPAYARDAVAAVREDPAGAFIWGLIVGVGVPIVLALLALTVIGLLVTIPGLLLLVVLGIVGNAVTIVWLGAVVGDGAVDGRAVAVGAVVYAVLATPPVLGNLLTSLIGFVGLGVVGRGVYRSWRGGRGTRETRPPERRERPPHQ